MSVAPGLNLQPSRASTSRAAAALQPLGAGGTLYSDVFEDVFVARQHASLTERPAEENPSMIKHFFKGFAAPFNAFLQHPAKMTALMVGGMALAHWLPMTLAPILIIGGALSLFEGGKSLIQVVHYRAEGDKKSAAKAMEGVGTAAMTGVLIALGNKGGASVTAENKATLLATQQGKSPAEVARIAEEAAQAAKSGSFMNAVRENLSVFTSRDGFKALLHTFSRNSIRKNFHIPFVTKHSADTHLHPKSSTSSAKGSTGFIASFIDDLVILSFAKSDHEHQPRRVRKQAAYSARNPNSTYTGR